MKRASTRIEVLNVQPQYYISRSPNDLPPRLFLLVRKLDEGFEISARDSSAARASIDVGNRFVPGSFDRGDRGCEFSLPFRVLNRTSPLVRRGASQPLAPRLPVNKCSFL
jgi:hypothetical protein